MRKKQSRNRTNLENSALLRTRSVVDRMRALYRELEQLTDAPITLHRALLCIGEDPGLSVSVLAVRSGMKRPAMSQALKSMTSRGWVTRRASTTDRRSVHLDLTAAGRQVLKLTSGRAVGMLKRAIQNLTLQDLLQLDAGLAALLEELPSQRFTDSVARRTAVPSRD
jgi:DNA-binding MarR family transcriptional regulator